MKKRRQAAGRAARHEHVGRIQHAKVVQQIVERLFQNAMTAVENRLIANLDRCIDITSEARTITIYQLSHF